MAEAPHPVRRRTEALRWVLPAVIFVAVLALLAGPASEPGPYRIDEAHKVGETYFLGLAIRGDFGHPDWSGEIEERTNPPVGKFLFGLSALLHGAEIPGDMTMARAGLEAVQPPPHLAERYRPALVASRRVSVAATALTAAVLCFAAIRLGGLAAAVLAVVLYLGNFLTRTFAAVAVYDPLLTCFVALTLLPLIPIWRGSRREVWWSCLAGVFAALAFQVRASGLIALAAFGVTLSVLSLRRKSARPLLLILVATVTCLVLSTMINPFYWAVQGDGARLPLRIVERYQVQIQDQRLVLEEAQRRGGTLSLAERPRFVAETALADWAGMLSLAGLLLALYFLVRSPAREHLLLACSWGLPIIVLVLLWLPLPWPRYMLVLVPPLSLIGALGWSHLLHAFKLMRRYDGGP